MNKNKFNRKNIFFKKEQIKLKIIQKNILISIIINIILFIWQIIIGIFSHSSGLIFESIHILTDLIIDFIIITSNKKSHKLPDNEHPYGHFRYENRTLLFLGIILLVIGISMEWSVIQKILKPNIIYKVHRIALITILTSIFIKELLFHYIINIANKINSNILKINAWHLRLDAISSIVVAIGIIGNLLGIKFFDIISALIIGLFILKIGFKLTNQSMEDLIDKGADNKTLKKIYEILDNIKELKGYHDLKTRKSGNFYLIDIHLELDGYLTITQGHKIAIKVRKKLMENPIVLNVMTHVDPY